MAFPASRHHRRSIPALAVAVLGVWPAAPAGAQFLLRFEPAPAYVDTPVSALLTVVEHEGCGFTWLLDPLEPSLEEAGDDGVIDFLLDYQCPIEPGPPHLATGTIELGTLDAGAYVMEFHDATGGRVVARGGFEVFARPPCTSSDTTLCLRDGRFGASVQWTDFVGNRGSAHAAPRDPAAPFRADTGFMWFFAPDNLELTIKVLDGCGLNGHFWVFISPGSTVEYTIAVSDHATGRSRTYANPAGNLPKLFADTSAFPCP